VLKALLLLVLIATLCGCGSEGERESARRERKTAERHSQPLPPAPERAVADEEPSEPRQPSGNAQEASDVLKLYYDAIAAREYDKAWSLRWKGRGDDEASRKAFTDRMKRYAEYRANVGQAGAVVEAGGYSYVDVPVQIFGRTLEGGPFSTAGTVTLRRKGAEGWKIYSRD
jgi:hypothetical protein